MRKTLKMVLAVLDGKPAGMRGQSLVELTVTFPLLLLMLMGMAEIGWFANNYLIMTDVVRSAGRAGALGNPTKWQPFEERNHERMDCDSGQNPAEPLHGENKYTRLPSDDPADYLSPKDVVPGATDGTETVFGTLGYYDNIACSAIANMAPLEFDDTKDDIIVSVFSYAVTPYGCQQTRNPASLSDPKWSDCTDVEITKRLPDTANSCGDGMLGYMFRGHFTPGGGACPGSAYSDAWMLEQLKKTLVQENGTIDPKQLEFVPNYGLVLVEIHWHSDQLIGLPVFQFAGGEIPMHVWSIFPVSAAEPDLP